MIVKSERSSTLTRFQSHLGPGDDDDDGDDENAGDEESDGDDASDDDDDVDGDDENDGDDESDGDDDDDADDADADDADADGPDNEGNAPGSPRPPPDLPERARHEALDHGAAVVVQQVHLVDDEQLDELRQRHVTSALARHHIPLLRSRHQHLAANNNHQ